MGPFYSRKMLFSKYCRFLTFFLILVLLLNPFIHFISILYNISLLLLCIQVVIPTESVRITSHFIRSMFFRVWYSDKNIL